MVLRFCMAFVLLYAAGGSLMAQEATRVPVDTATVSDSLVVAPRPTIDSASLGKAVDEVRRKRRGTDTSLVRQLSRMEEYAERIAKMSGFFQRGVDTANLSDELDDMEEQLRLTKDGVVNHYRHPNLRNLVASNVLLNEMEKQLDAWQEQVMGYNKQLIGMRSLLDSMGRDSLMRVIPADSVLAQQYAQRLYDLIVRFRPIDSITKAATIEVGVLQGRIVRLLLDVKDQQSIIGQAIKLQRRNYFQREEPPIWRAREHHSTLSSIFSTSVGKAKLALKYYLRSTLNVSVLVLLTFLLLWFTVRMMIRRLLALQKDFLLDQFVPHVRRSVPLSALFIALSLSQLLYSNIPMVFLQLAWLLMWLASTYLFWKDLSAEWHRIWLGFGLLFLWACLENLVLESTVLERWIMLFASAAGILLAWYALWHYRRSAAKSPYFRFFAWLLVVQELIGVIGNVSGMYSFGRAMAVGGYFNFVLGIMFFNGINLVKEMIVLSYEYYRRNDRLTSVVNLYELKQNAERFLPWLAWIGWFIVFAKNLNFYEPLVDAISTFLSTERKLGNIEFSFGSVAIFFITIWVSTVLAQFVSFLLGGNKSQVSTIQKTRFGSSILVLKLGIISLGILVAFAASGIPMDKITIIIGALGVGIGFGLQNIVNNLVSGVILAFEKPIEIGDQIEVGGRLGKVKEIGIRSSKLATFEGAEVIIPNGDLLSQHVVNWTLSNNHRRVEIIVGVRYGSQLNIAKLLLEELLVANNKVDRNPAPLVLVHQFNQSSIDFRLLFWTDISQWVELKSEIHLAVDEAFKKAGIEIPFPQQDVYIKQMPDRPAPPPAGT